MMMPMESLQRRFERLRMIVSVWEIRYNQLPDQVVSRFDESDLNSIAALLTEKRQLEHLIPDVKDFIERWEGQVDLQEAVSSSVGHSDPESDEEQ